MTPEAKRAYHRNSYATRKLAGLCIDCAAGLQEDDGLRCMECAELERLYARRYRANGGQTRENVKAKARRIERQGAGLCAWCRSPVVPGSVLCHGHALSRSKTRARLRAAKRAGIVAIRPPRSLALPSRVDTTEQRASGRISLLSVLSNSEWLSMGQVLERLHTEQSERNTRTVLLGRLVKQGLIERRGAWRHASEYQITPAGRAELARLTERRAA